MGVENAEIHRSNMGWEPVYVEDNLALVSIGFMLNDASQAVIWRGPKKNSIIPPRSFSPSFSHLHNL